MASKADHVQHQARRGQRRNCLWPGCTAMVPHSMWGCKKHWFMLPKPIRDRIWAAYRPGQEDDLDIARDYLDAIHAAENWIMANHPPRAQR